MSSGMRGWSQVSNYVVAIPVRLSFWKTVGFDAEAGSCKVIYLRREEVRKMNKKCYLTHLMIHRL